MSHLYKKNPSLEDCNYCSQLYSENCNIQGVTCDHWYCCASIGGLPRPLVLAWGRWRSFLVASARRRSCGSIGSTEWRCCSGAPWRSLVLSGGALWRCSLAVLSGGALWRSLALSGALWRSLALAAYTALSGALWWSSRAEHPPCFRPTWSAP